MKWWVKWLILVGVLLILAIRYFCLTSAGVREINEYRAELQQADDESNYQRLKTVEDTCRSMIASYETDRMTWEQYKDDESQEHRSWAEQARMRANKTAAEYNNYILKNRYVWKANIPPDIHEELPLI